MVQHGRAGTQSLSVLPRQTRAHTSCLRAPRVLWRHICLRECVHYGDGGVMFA